MTIPGLKPSIDVTRDAVRRMYDSCRPVNSKAATSGGLSVHANLRVSTGA